MKHKVATGIIKWYLSKNGFKAWTSAWNTIYYIDEVAMADKCLVTHEMVHVRQMQNYGKILFMIKYSYYTIKYGYRNNPYEVEAYNAQEMCNQIRSIAKDVY
jgi:hypothetical protein